MSFCIKCADIPCGQGEGLISVHWNTTSTAKPVGGACTTSTPDNPDFVAGPVTGTVSIQAYASSSNVVSIQPVGFVNESRVSDLWLGSKCITRISAQQNNLLKYDGKTDKHILIPTSINSASRTGSEVPEVTMDFLCGMESYQMSLAGSVTLVNNLGTDIGHSLKYTGGPYNMSFPDANPKKIMGLAGCYQSGFSLNIEYPNSPAQVSYTWQFVLNCSDGSGGSGRDKRGGGVVSIF